MNRLYHLFALLLLTLVFACDHRNGHKTNSHEMVQENDSNYWEAEAQKQYDKLAYYYNNNIHDTVIMMAPDVIDFCREHKLWTEYYDSWTLLGQEYNFFGNHIKATKVAQEIHNDATKRGNKYGLILAEFIKGLVYDAQENHSRQFVQGEDGRLRLVHQRCGFVQERHAYSSPPRVELDRLSCGWDSDSCSGSC